MNRRELLKTIPAVLALPSISAVAQKPAGRVLLRSALCAYSYREELKARTVTYDDLVRIAAENGADGLDLTVYWMPEDTPDSFLLPLRRLAYKSGVHIYSIAIRAVMCQPTAELREAEAAKVRKWVDVAVKLGAGHIRVFGGNLPKGLALDQGVAFAAETLRRSAEYASRHGILLGIEDDGGITATAEPVVRIVQQADSPWVGINLDVGNFESNALPQIAMCIPHAVNVHMKTEMPDEAGVRRKADWDKVLGMLAGGGYRGYVALEYEAKENASTAVPRLLRDLRSAIRRVEAVA